MLVSLPIVALCNLTTVVQTQYSFVSVTVFFTRLAKTIWKSGTSAQKLLRE